MLKAELGDLRPVRRRGVRWRWNAAGLMELRDAQASPRWIELNAAASHIWELCDGRRTVNAVAGVMAVRLGAPPTAAQRLTRDFITLLHDYKLLGYQDLRCVYRVECGRAPDGHEQENR